MQGSRHGRRKGHGRGLRKTRLSLPNEGRKKTKKEAITFEPMQTVNMGANRGKEMEINTVISGKKNQKGRQRTFDGEAMFGMAEIQEEGKRGVLSDWGYRPCQRRTGNPRRVGGCITGKCIGYGKGDQAAGHERGKFWKCLHAQRPKRNWGADRARPSSKKKSCE